MRSVHRLPLALTLLSAIVLAVPAAAETVELDAVRDTTIYGPSGSNLSNGAGDSLHVGRNGGGDPQRALLAFDPASVVPAGATVTAVQLVMRMTRTQSDTPRTLALHRVLESWTEGDSHASRGEGGGASAETDDATWDHRSFPTTFWSDIGGTFDPTASASAAVGPPDQSYTWGSTARLVADVQGWVDDPSTAHGWIVVGAESSGPGTSKRFDSRTGSTPPRLLVTYTAASAPVASFTWSPDTPVIGATVELTDQSSGSPTSWTWEFGDGATSDDQNPTHVYTTPGTYTVTLTVSNASGSDSASAVIEVAGDGPPLTERTLVAAVARAPGVAPAFFVTDVDVHNAGDEQLLFRFALLERGADNSNPVRSATYTLDPDQSLRFTDVVDAAFGLDGALGSLLVESDREAVRVVSRTYTTGGAGTFGQSLPGIPEGDLIGPDERIRILFMTENSDYRSNLGLVNGSESQITIRYELFDATGASLALRNRPLGPLSNTQVNRVFAPFAPVEAGWVELWSETPGAAFTAYGSVLDEITDDPTTVLPVPVP